MNNESYPDIDQRIDLRLRLKEFRCDALKVLNVGAGNPFVVRHGFLSQMRFINFKQLDHIEIYPSALDKVKGAEWAAQVVGFILGDIRDFDFSDYDLILMFDVIEHLYKEDGLKVLGRVKHGLVFIPIEKELMKANPKDPNPYQIHVSRWNEEELKGLGFGTEVLNNYHQTFGAMWGVK